MPTGSSPLTPPSPREGRGGINVYKLMRPILFQIEEETMHNTVSAFAKLLSPFSGVFRLPFAFEHPSLETEAFGIKFKNPVGLAPGFDKAGGFARSMASLGFGFVEVGSITPAPQPGNPKPRLFRLDGEQAIVNRMGFNSIGMKSVAENLKRLESRDFVIGVNLGKNKTTPNEQAVKDYLTGMQELGPLVDYVVINVSSPNTPGLRELQNKENLRNILTVLQSAGDRPLLVKISPDLTEQELDDIIEVMRETKIAGVIAANTISTPDGGLSGKPLREKSTRIISYLYHKLDGQIIIIGSGGIFSADDAYEKILAGASLVEIYTGLVFEGPGLVKKIKKGLVKLLERDGFKNIGQAVGAGIK